MRKAKTAISLRASSLLQNQENKNSNFVKGFVTFTESGKTNTVISLRDFTLFENEESKKQQLR